LHSLPFQRDEGTPMAAASMPWVPELAPRCSTAPSSSQIVADALRIRSPRRRRGRELAADYGTGATRQQQCGAIDERQRHAA